MTPTGLEGRIHRSAERLVDLMGPLHAPRAIVDSEFRLLIQSIAGLIGPDRVRRWLDDVTDRQLATMSNPTCPCRRCGGLGMLFGTKEDGQCPQCCGVGKV